MDKKQEVITSILQRMQPALTESQYTQLRDTLAIVLHPIVILDEKAEVIVYDGFNEQVVRQYLGTLLVEGKSKKTIERYQLIVRMMLEFFGKSVKEITTNDIRYYLAFYQEKRGVSGTTLDGMRRVIAAFFNWLEAEDYIYKSPARRVARIKKDTKQEKEFTESEMELLGMACENDRDRAMLEFLYATAARVSEVAKINISDVDFKNKIVLLHGKGGKDRIAFFTDKAMLYLQKYLETRTDTNEALFISLKKPYTRVTKSSIEQMVSKLGEKAAIRKVHPHRFRVTRITVLVNRGMPLQDVQEIAGHSDINTTKMYYRANAERVKYEYMKIA